MKQSRVRSYIIVVFCLIVTATLSFCSDSESRLPFKSDSTKVIIDLGNKPKSGDMRLAVAPTGITSITITVTGPGMAAMTTTFPPTQTILELEVPSGILRTFNVLVKTVSRDYVGTAIAALPAGQTISVPVVMYPSGNVDEGSADAPVFITAGEVPTPYAGTVGTGRSYYVTNVGSDTNLSVQIFDLTDDADLISYSGDSYFISPIAPNLGESYCGRTIEENLYANYEPDTYSDYYFVVDGSHTKNGASFVISCSAFSGTLVGDPPVGDISSPLVVPVGRLVETWVGSPLFTNYYVSSITIGKEYCVNYRNGSGTTDLFLYRDEFLSIYDNMPFIAERGFLYIMAQNIQMDNFNLEVVTSEGTPENPVEIYPDETGDFWGRAYYCMVGGGGSSSYYRLPLTSDEYQYDLYVTNIQGNVDMYMYDNPSFTGTPIYVSTQSDLTDEYGWFTNTSLLLDAVYVQIVDMNGFGSTFILNMYGFID